MLILYTQVKICSNYWEITKKCWVKQTSEMFLPGGYMAQSIPTQQLLFQTPTPGMSRCETRAGWSTSWPWPWPCSIYSWSQRPWFEIQPDQAPCQEGPCLPRWVAEVWTSRPAGPGSAWRRWESGRFHWDPEAFSLGPERSAGQWWRGWPRPSPHRWPSPGAAGSSARGLPTRAGRQMRSRNQTISHMWSIEGSRTCKKNVRR